MFQLKNMKSYNQDAEMMHLNGIEFQTQKYQIRALQPQSVAQCICDVPPHCDTIVSQEERGLLGS